eukprot:COSAG01_NODE_1411_length_10408_cov_6.595402_1_plen_224_part_00
MSIQIDNPLHGDNDSNDDVAAATTTTTSEVAQHVREAAEHKLDRSNALQDEFEGAHSVRATGRALKAVFGGVTGDVFEQSYLFMNAVQSMALFTMPDFIDWPSEWWDWARFTFGFSFGFFGLALPNSPGWALVGSLSIPPLILARGVYLRWRLENDEYKKNVATKPHYDAYSHRIRLVQQRGRDKRKIVSKRLATHVFDSCGWLVCPATLIVGNYPQHDGVVW